MSRRIGRKHEGVTESNGLDLTRFSIFDRAANGEEYRHVLA